MARTKPIWFRGKLLASTIYIGDGGWSAVIYGHGKDHNRLIIADDECGVFEVLHREPYSETDHEA